MEAEVAALPTRGPHVGPLKSCPHVGPLKSWKMGKALKRLPVPLGLLGPPFPFPALAAEGDGWATWRVSSGLTARLGLWVCVGGGHGGSVDHDLSTAGGHQLVSQCALSEGMEGLEFCPPPGAGWGWVSSGAIGLLPPPAPPPITGSYLIQGHFVTEEEPIYYRERCVKQHPHRSLSLTLF